MKLRCYYFTKKKRVVCKIPFCNCCSYPVDVYMFEKKKHNTFIYRFAVNAFQGRHQ